MSLGRCPEPGCPFRFRDGIDRVCIAHARTLTDPSTYGEVLARAQGDRARRGLSTPGPLVGTP